MRKVAMILAVTLLIFQTGCWNAREINELAFVLSIALDKAEEGFYVTAQVAKPEVYSKSGTGGGGTEKEKPFWVISGSGKTIFEAIRNMAEISPRRVFWSHIKVIIISEEIAREDVLDIFDFFSRNPELRLRTWIAVTEGKAGKILDIMPVIEKDPSHNIEQIINKTNITGKGYSIMLKNFLEEYLDPYTDPVASRITVTTVNSKPTVRLEGAAVFDIGKMVGWLDAEETRGLLWMKNKISNSIRVVDCPYDGKPLTIEIKKGKINIKSQINNGVPSFTITATAVGKLTEKSGLTEYNNPETIKTLEAALAKAIHDDIEQAVTAAQKYHADFINFTRALQIEHKKEWEQISSSWPEQFRTAKVDINVKADIPEVSLLAKSLAPR